MKKNILSVYKRAVFFSTNNIEKTENVQKISVVKKQPKYVMYVPNEKLDFEKNGKCLLYYYRPRSSTSLLHYSTALIPLYYLTKWIRVNPWFLTFPASLPLMIIAEFYFLKKLLDKKKLFRDVLCEIYLHKDGETLEVIYLNQFWRKLKNDDVEKLLYIPTLKTPPQGEKYMPLKGDLFPEVYPYNDTVTFAFGWSKYYRLPRNRLIIPKYCNYINLEVLVEVFKGNKIDTSKKNINEIDYVKKDKYFDL